MLTGKIHTRPSTKEYEENWDKIFGKKETEEKTTEKPEEDCRNCDNCSCITDIAENQ
jgi:hypothetical protein